MPIQFTDLGADILLVEGLLPLTFCKHLIEVLECFQLQAAGIAVERVDTKIRSNDLLRLGGSDPLLQSTNQLLLAQVASIQTLLHQHYGVAFPHSEDCSLLRYQSGQFYKRHVDNLLLASRFAEIAQGLPTRDISLVGYLNEDFEGGETFFDRQNLKVKPQTGSVLVFPAYYTHPHQSLAVIEGQKYAWTTWLFH
ncbi:2OG-Fe(II) oxygenase [Leptolyngbya sp. FACHB-261]|uniref:prolyl hydroxylase family protein n=1 Tax=Leptolyngbya sp. FACHB-261 TaxID=2692806 RepID=UPI0016851290|nr:2OG-Fe(II) oxygenase [Leptolyngbya sp. FACHB-261]MBD2101476.1 2OG-Fe(II) oxygenase [Leptolyngbya sp. FACHB-261]